MKNIQLSSLTSLRFFAALMVFFSHMDFLRIHEDAAGNPDRYQDIYNTWMFEGYSGVTFFFILSGFILAHSYQDRIIDQKTSTVDFYIFRIARIVPLHWLTLALAIYLQHTNSASWDFFSPTTFWPNLLMLHAWFSNMDIAFSYNLVSWSLSVEMFFYAMFPLLIRFGTRTLIVIFLLLIAFILAWLPITIPFAPFHLPIYTNLTKYYAYWYPAFRAGDFLAGIILYRAWCARKELTAVFAGSLQGISIVILCIFYSLHAGVDETYRFDFYYALPMTFLIYAFAHQNGIFSRMLSNRIMIVLGEASFAFYMIHQLAIYHMNYKIVRYNDTLLQFFYIQDKPEYAVGIHLLICITLSFALFFLFERPAQYLCNKMLFGLKNMFKKRAVI
jgi:peptidoglycan/LPS O-acetylase OafA/YrhL